MIRLIYWLYLKVFDIPCRTQVLEVVLDGAPLSKSIAIVARDYAMGYSIDDVAKFHKITRERARQYLLAAVRNE